MTAVDKYKPLRYLCYIVYSVCAHNIDDDDDGRIVLGVQCVYIKQHVVQINSARLMRNFYLVLLEIEYSYLMIKAIHTHIHTHLHTEMYTITHQHQSFVSFNEI